MCVPVTFLCRRVCKLWVRGVPGSALCVILDSNGSAHHAVSHSLWLPSDQVDAAAAGVFTKCLHLVMCSPVLQLEVVHGGVSKVLRNTSDPDPSPEKKMAGLLGKQQAAAYLTASAGEAEAQAYEAHHDNKQQQQLEALTAVQEARGAVPVPASHVELPSAAHARTGAAAHAMLEPPARVAYTDGGAPCTSLDTTGVAAVAASASLNRLRRSLDMQQGGYVAEDGSCSSRTEGASPRTPSSAGTEQPSAVAVIEARSADGKKQVLGMRMEGPKGVEAMVLGKQMPQPAFVQLANVQAKQC